MAEEYNVTFCAELLKKAEEMKVLNELLSFMPEDTAKQTKAILRAFAKHGVPAKTVLAAIYELSTEGGLNDG